MCVDSFRCFNPSIYSSIVYYLESRCEGVSINRDLSTTNSQSSLSRCWSFLTTGQRQHACFLYFQAERLSRGPTAFPPPLQAPYVDAMTKSKRKQLKQQLSLMDITTLNTCHFTIKHLSSYLSNIHLIIISKTNKPQKILT